MSRLHFAIRLATTIVATTFLAAVAGTAPASDHLDAPAVVANPSADIGDVYAWMAPDGRRLNLVMTIVGRVFSDRLTYTFHVDSGARFGKTTATTSIACRFNANNKIDCRAGQADRATGDASGTEGLEGRHHRFRVFAGLRDDPFFNNVKGSRDAFQAAGAALRSGVHVDSAGCPQFDAATVQTIRDRWRHTEGGPARDFLGGWTSSAIVVSIDVDVVNKGGQLLAIWGATSNSNGQIDRAGRPLTANALLTPLGPDEVSDKLKGEYNRATPATSAQFQPEIQKSLALYDGYDGKCGNQLLALDDPKEDADLQYLRLAMALTDDRLWVNSTSAVCTQFFAVELADLAGEEAAKTDCGGRTPLYNAANIFRSLLVNGTRDGIDDGLDHDESEHSASTFPYLAAPVDSAR